MSVFDPDVFSPPLRVPVLTRPPVRLRPYEPTDVSMICRASRDPAIPSISSVPRDCTDEGGRAFVDRQHRLAAEGHGYSFVITRHDGGPAALGVGSIGLWLHEIAFGRASLGYWLLAEARGQGLAASAVRVVAAFGFTELAIPRLHLFVEPENDASARAARAAGFRREARLRSWERVEGTQRDVDCYAAFREDWRPLNS